jgi:hypothetical protein
VFSNEAGRKNLSILNLRSDANSVLQPSDFRWFVLQYRVFGETLVLPKFVLTDLKDALIDLASAYEDSVSDGFLRAAPSNPGYLEGVCGAWSVYVPWPLARYFPAPNVLHEILELANQTSIQSAGSICVSGSVTSLGSGIPIGDMDFCQYVSASPKDYIDAAATFAQPNKYRVLVTASYGMTNSLLVRAPWSENWPSLTARMGACGTIAEADRFMVDFIGKSPGFGVLPVSTVILSSDFDDQRHGAARFSFAYQEAISVQRHEKERFAIWSLADPYQLGKYLTFLEDQIFEYIDKKPIKALKRAFSLARIMRLDVIAEMAREVLVKPEFAHYVAEQRQYELSKMRALCDIGFEEILRQDFEIVPGEGRYEKSTLESIVFGGCQDVVNRLRDVLRELDADLGEGQIA